MDSNDHQTIFILGILRRSGTNYVADLLMRHKDCQRVRTISEDFLLAHADALDEYVRRVSDAWSPKWDPDGSAARQLREALGAACLGFLATKTREVTDKRTPFLVTKSPSVANLSLFPMFPGAQALVVIRDGRSVAESGARSFGWSLEKVARDWAAGAEEILDARERAVPFLLVRYEDLVRDVRSELRRVFDEVGLDPARYNFEAAENLPVRGSSTFGAEQGVHWERVERTSEFDPLERWAEWTAEQHERFNALAGAQMEALGYELVRG